MQKTQRMNDRGINRCRMPVRLIRLVQSQQVHLQNRQWNLAFCLRPMVDAPAFVTDKAGTVWMAFHAWHPHRVGYGNGGMRSLHLVALDVVNGRPCLL